MKSRFSRFAALSLAALLLLCSCRVEQNTADMVTPSDGIPNESDKMDEPIGGDIDSDAEDTAKTGEAVGSDAENTVETDLPEIAEPLETIDPNGKTEPTGKTESNGAAEPSDTTEPNVTVDSADFTADIALSDIPEYVGEPYAVIHDNEPFFSEEAKRALSSFELYSPRDELGRCGTAYACLAPELMPTEKRESIGSVKPSGWQTARYDFVDGGYLYNRCHLIGFQLAGENANPDNLITGTRYMNTEGMLPFENMTADYIKETSSHVLYRVTPMYNGDEPVARGVLMEAYSLSDDGDGIEFCVFCYNVQPGVSIQYATGESEAVTENTEDTAQTSEIIPEQTAVSQTYMLNTNTKKIHLPSCSAVSQMKEENKSEYTGDPTDLILRGYSACKKCKPF